MAVGDGVDDGGEPQEGGGSRVDETRTELHLERGPASVGQLHDGVDLEPVVVPVVEDLAV